MYSKLKRKIYEIIEPDAHDYKISNAFDMFIMALIVLNVIVIILDTVQSIPEIYHYIFRMFNIFSVIVFTIEYILRIWTATENPKYKEPVRGRLRFMESPLAIIDLVAILPFYLPFVTTIDLRFLRALRLLRILKLTRYSKSFSIMMRVLRLRRGEIFVTAIIVIILLVISSSLMYFVENDDQPDVFKSIPHAMWWSIATLSTVGYGDVSPVSPMGKVLGGIVAVLGVALFALPAGIIGSGFLEEIQKEKREAITCPHCGKTIDHSHN